MKIKYGLVEFCIFLFERCIINPKLCFKINPTQYEELLMFCYASHQNGQPWIRKFVIHKFKIVQQYEKQTLLKNLKILFKLDLCSCRLRKVYLYNIGYFQSLKERKYLYVQENQNMIIVFTVCLTLYICFSLFSYLLESMEFI